MGETWPIRRGRAQHLETARLGDEAFAWDVQVACAQPYSMMRRKIGTIQSVLKDADGIFCQ